MYYDEFSDIPEILPVKSDFVFKLVFGDERNKDILAAFLNAVTKIPLEDLKNLELVNNELNREYAEDKRGILDVHVKLRDGKQIDIEVQVAPLLIMPERSLFYLAKMYTGQLPKGGSYVSLQKCIAINIVDYVCIGANQIHTVFHFREDTQKDCVLTDKMEVHFLELPYLKDTELVNQEEDAIINWMQFINAKSREVLKVLARKGTEFSKAADILEAISRDEKNRALYEAKQKQIRDEQARMIEAKQSGIQEGRKKEAYAITRKLLKLNMGIEQISNITGLSPKEIQNLPINE